MAYEQKENSGAIFKNEKREKDTHPNMTGTALIGGVEYFISGWTKEGKNGKWLSLAFKPKEAKPQAQSKPSSGVTDDLTDDIPW
mgnify:CR=1 FL=1